MSASSGHSGYTNNQADSSPTARENEAKAKVTPKQQSYHGFVAGVFSGIAKLSVGHPFDTVKVRLQTSQRSQFGGPWDCVLATVRNEGVRAFYKGATPPLLGWMAMDSLMLGSLTQYRRLLHEHVFTPDRLRSSPLGFSEETIRQSESKLPAMGHAVAGVGAGWTVSFIAAPVEHIKARLQVQYAADKSRRMYSGPVDCTKRIVSSHGIRGLYHGLSATLLFRTFFCFWWGSYDLFTTFFSTHTNLSAPAVNFWSGGLSAQIFWLTSYPSDVVKQRIMTDPLGGSLSDGQRKYPRWRDAARDIWIKDGMRGYWRGFLPCFLRAFPANAAALVAFEGVMRTLRQ